MKNFRGFRELEVAPLKRINLLVAKNNVGKTSFLEGVTLLVNGVGAFQNLPTLLRNAKHPDVGSEFWSWLFFNHSFESDAIITGEYGTEKEDISIHCHRIGDGKEPQGYHHQFDFLLDGAQYRIWIKTEPEMAKARHPRNRSETTGGVKVFSTNPMDPVEESRKYHKVMLKKGGEERIQELLKVVEPRLMKIRPAQLGQTRSIYADIGLEEIILVSQMGQGFCRVLSIYSALFLSEAKVFLIDEVENGIHYSCLDQLWKGIAEVAKLENVQVFATTHSWECIAAAQRVFAERESDEFAAHRIEIVNGDVQAKTYDKEALAASIEAGWEIR